MRICVFFGNMALFQNLKRTKVFFNPIKQKDKSIPSRNKTKGCSPTTIKISRLIYRSLRDPVLQKLSGKRWRLKQNYEEVLCIIHVPCNTTSVFLGFANVLWKYCHNWCANFIVVKNFQKFYIAIADQYLIFPDAYFCQNIR